MYHGTPAISGEQLSYIDALFDREHDRIHTVERRDGVRVYKEYPANYIFYYDDPRGKFRSIYGTPVSRFSTRNNKESLTLRACSTADQPQVEKN
jgi:hypothetical protein